MESLDNRINSASLRLETLKMNDVMKAIKPYIVSTDKTPQFTVKEVSDMTDLSAHTIRYYDKEGLLPAIDRSAGDARLFSDYAISWLKLVHCLRITGLSINGVRHYIQMCLQGDETIPQRAALIYKQEELLAQQLHELQQQMEVLSYKKKYYQDLLSQKIPDTCNPQTLEKNEPLITPLLKK